MRHYDAVRYAPMEGRMPPVNPTLGITREVQCYMLCLKDVTCAGFSYSKLLSFCMLMGEKATDDVIAISNQMPHFYHFTVKELVVSKNVLLPQGYRWHDDLDLALRFHIENHRTRDQALEVCTVEGGVFVTIDTNDKMITVLNLLNTNSKLMSGPDNFYVAPTNTTSTAPVGQCDVLNRSGDFQQVDCNTQLPFICEKSNI
ncbi:hypothetical protein SNE40_004947 [Patella caerulea]